MLDSAATAQRPLTVRAAVTNDMLLLRGVDGRSLVARRYRDVVHSLVAELGGEGKLDEASRILVKQAAALTVRVEAMQADIVEGRPINDEQLTRMSNVLARTLERLRAFRKGDKPQSLDEYLKGAT